MQEDSNRKLVGENTDRGLGSTNTIATNVTKTPTTLDIPLSQVAF